MKVRTGCIVTDIRGGIGNLTVSRNAYGLFAREIVTPLDPVSSFKSAMRLKWKETAQAWRTLTEVQRATFHRNALQFSERNVFGEHSSINGFNLFMRLGYYRKIFNFSVLTSCPPPSIIASRTSLSLISTSSTQRMLMSSSPAISSVQRLFLYASLQVSAGLSQNSVRYYFVAYLASGYPTTTYIHDLYFARMSGPLVAGRKIFIKLVTIDQATGIPSIPIFAYSIVT